MNAPSSLETDSLVSPLISAARCPEIPESSDIYGWLVGSWDLEVLRYWATDVSAQDLQGEVHAQWVLEGRAVQDVWIMPPRSKRQGAPNKEINMYGTTLRLWDATLQAWRITWRNPAGDHHEDQIGRRDGRDIIQLGVRPEGTQTRWSFREITDHSFHWLGESLAPGAKAWTLEGEFRGRRVV